MARCRECTGMHGNALATLTHLQALAAATGDPMNAPPSTRSSWILRLVVLLLCCGSSNAAPPLPSLGVDSKVTVSGLSSGGYMAAQFAVAFSGSVQGVGVLAGGPFDCAQGDLQQATTRCSCAAAPWCSTPTPSVLAFQSANRASGKAAVEQVDPLRNLKAQRVWLFSGGKDKTVPAANVKAIELFYVAQMKLPRSKLRHRSIASAGHGLPVLPKPAGAVACSASAYPFLTDCPLDAAGDLLQWLYPGSVASGPTDAGQLLEFDQQMYTQDLGYTGLGDTGYVYVPDACTSVGAACRLHVVFHGCRQARESDDGQGGTVSDRFARDAGYNRWAAGSRIVVLYPQVQPTDTGNPLVAYGNNPRGCWDFWGYTQPVAFISRQVTNMAPQMLAVRAMMAALQRQ
jgi:poly(3-hydroxybutyrate) depolymerase